MDDITKVDVSPENAKTLKAAKKLEKSIRNESAKFNEKIKKLGENVGIILHTEIKIIIE